MLRRITLGCLILSAAPLAAQTPPTPGAACRAQGIAYENQADAADRAAKRKVNVDANIAEARKRARECAKNLSRKTGTIAELSSLASLDLYLADTAQAKATIDRL